MLLEALKTVAEKYCLDYTGDPDILDNEAVTVVILTLIADMWENRNATIQSNMVANPLISNILGMYSVNLLPEAGDK